MAHVEVPQLSIRTGCRRCGNPLPLGSGGEKPTVEQLTEIAVAFAKDFGFENNQLIVFRHLDKAHDHQHIAANRINYNGKNTAGDFNNYARTGKFCRRMEFKLGLQITPEMYLTNPERQEQ